LTFKDGETVSCDAGGSAEEETNVSIFHFIEFEVEVALEDLGLEIARELFFHIFVYVEPMLARVVGNGAGVQYFVVDSFDDI
jgi:hypothetical protein